MNELSKFLVEQILLEEPTPIKKTIVVYSGRFQPFHKGHYATYSNLVKKFGKDNVYIGTSNKVERPKSPFNFKEKKSIMTTMFGIPSNKIYELKNPYAPTEILKSFNDESTAFVTVVGEKDASRLGGKYFKKYDGKPTEGYKNVGYVYASPAQPNPVSGTDVRVGLGSGTEEQKKNFFLDKAYTKFNKTIFLLITSKLQESCIRLTKTQIEDLILERISMGDLSAGDFVGADDGPNTFFPSFEAFNYVNAERAKVTGWQVIQKFLEDDFSGNWTLYPEGPVNSVSYFPAGVIGKTTSTNQVDIYAKGAYDKWYTHATRKATLLGWAVVDRGLDNDDFLATNGSIGDEKELGKEFNKKTIDKRLKEAITLPVEIGDTLLMGKFKNKKVVVKSIGKDEHGMPTINGKKVVTFRLVKEGKHIIFEAEKEDEKYTHISFGNYKLKGQEKNTESPTFRKGEDGKYVQVGDNSKKKEQPKQGTSLEPQTPAGKSYQQQLPDKDPAKTQKSNKIGSDVINNLKSRTSSEGEKLDVDTTENGSLIIGVEHGNNKESNKQAIEQIKKLPKDTKVMFVGEGGMSKDISGNIEFGGEQDEFRNVTLNHFENAEETSWDENANVFDGDSPVFDEIAKSFDGSKSKAFASVWSNMYGQDGKDAEMVVDDYLDDEGKDWLVGEAKKGGSKEFDGEVDWNNLTDEQQKDLYELNFRDDDSYGETEIFKGQESYNNFRQLELDRKIKEAEDNGFTVIAPVGNSHVDLWRKRNKPKKEWMGSNPVMMEALTQAQRASRRWTFAKNQKLINIKKQRTQLRKKSYEILYKRAYKLAYLYVRKERTQLLFGTTPYNDLSIPQKNRVSQMVQKKKGKILKLTKFRFLPALKQKEADRFKRDNQYSGNLTFNTTTDKISEDLFGTSLKLKLHEALIVKSVVSFMMDKFSFNAKIIVKKKPSVSMIGDISLSSTSVDGNKFYLHFNPNQSYERIIQTMIHELTHVKQVSKKELLPNKDYTAIMWKGKEYINVKDYNKLMKSNPSGYMKLPWEVEAITNMKSLYPQFKNSKYWKELKGKDATLDYVIANESKTIVRKNNFQTSNSVLTSEAGGDCGKPLPNETEDQFRTRCFGYNPLTPPPSGMVRGENKNQDETVKFYEKYYRNLTPSGFKVESENNIIKIEILKKVEEIAPHGYPDQEWMDNHEKKMKKLRIQLDKQHKETYK